MSTRVLIADDSPAVRAGLTGILAGTEFEVAAQAATCDQALQYTLTCVPDLVLLDLRMPDGDSFRVAERIKAEHPETRVLCFTAAEDVASMIRAYETGADGFLSKAAGKDQFLQVMRRVSGGKQAWTRRQLRQVGTGRRHAHDPSFLHGELTQREGNVLDLIAAGLENEEIAERLQVGVEAVKQHVKSVLRKLGVEDRTQAALWALHNKNAESNAVQGSQ